jgi:hypothetical protein
LYERLCEVAGELQVKLKRRVSLDEAMEYLLREKRLKVSDFAGAWNMSDDEEAGILKAIEDGRLKKIIEERKRYEEEHKI